MYPGNATLFTASSLAPSINVTEFILIEGSEKRGACLEAQEIEMLIEQAITILVLKRQTIEFIILDRIKMES